MPKFTFWWRYSPLRCARCFLARRSFADMERFGQEKCAWLKSRLGLRLHCGVPSHDTFGRIFAALDAHAFGAAMQTWTQALHQATEGRVVALDGKTVRRSFDSATGKGDHSPGERLGQRLRLGAWTVQSRGQKQRDHALCPNCWSCSMCGAASSPPMRSTLKRASRPRSSRKKRIMCWPSTTIMLCCIRRCKSTSPGAKNNPMACLLCARIALKGASGDMGAPSCGVVLWLGPQSRTGQRACGQWPGLQTLVMVESTRATGVGAHDQNERGTALLFEQERLPKPNCCSVRVRAHWGVENNVHWCLDVAFDEDGCRVRKDNAPENLWHLAALMLLICCDKKKATNEVS